MRVSLFHVALFSAVACGAVACHFAGTDAGAISLASFGKDSLAADIRILASDSFQGRRPFTAGETRTIDYLVKSYTALGLEPGNGNSYTQEVPLVEISPVAPPMLQLQSPKGKTDFQNLNDFVLWTERPDSVNTLDISDVVFAGFGVVAPEYNWNDYAGLDAKRQDGAGYGQ